MLLIYGGVCKYLAAPVSFKLGRRVLLLPQPISLSFCRFAGMQLCLMHEADLADRLA